MNLDTREWSDGVLTSISREVVKDATKRAWIVCDGDVSFSSLFFKLEFRLNENSG
jgi:hypothetical protein